MNITAAHPRNPSPFDLSRKPPLSKNRLRPVLIWKNLMLSAGMHKEKPAANDETVSGETLYTYVNNNPVNNNDPSGNWAVVDDAAFMVGGGVLGMVGRGAADLYNGQLSSWEDYSGSFVGGATAGEILLYTANPMLAGAGGSALGNVTTQGLKNITGQQSGFDATSFVIDTTVGTLTGGLLKGAPISGLNAGRNSYNAIFNQMVTKFKNGTISSVTPATIGKMFLGSTYETAMLPGITVGAVASDKYSTVNSFRDSTSTPTFNDFGNPNLNFPTYAGMGGANGGFVLYPNKANTNMMQRVYQK